MTLFRGVSPSYMCEGGAKRNANYRSKCRLARAVRDDCSLVIVPRY
jgi:hypothetical protein